MSAEYLRFGIPSLDFLFNSESLNGGISVPKIKVLEKNAAGVKRECEKLGMTSLCIAGPSGTGKSLLALHMASQYYADCAFLSPWKSHKRPRIVYLSTDLTFSRANEIWHRFALHLPNRRAAPYRSESVIPTKSHRSYSSGLRRPSKFYPKTEPNTSNLTINLIDGSLEQIPKLIHTIECPAEPGKSGEYLGEILFLNLAESSAGDDWSFVTRVLSMLRPVGPTDPLHLLIIDAVEGLEMMVGHTDAHGVERTRRSRIAQLLRTAVDKSHVALVLEEEKDGCHAPEEYVTDAVLRMRSTIEDGYQRRTLEVVKSRGQSSIRGGHNYFIRTSRNEDNPDDPPVVHPDGGKQAYVQVLFSLHCLTRELMRGAKDHSKRPAPFPEPACFQNPKLPGILLKDNGLPRGRVTVLFGEEGTLKGRFARAFLSGCFQYSSEKGNSRNYAVEVPVLITNANLSRGELIDRLISHADDPLKVDKAAVDERLIYRQLEVHDLSCSVFFHIIRRCVEEAIFRLVRMVPKGNMALEAERKRMLDPKRAWYEPSIWFAPAVRVVIDDWTVIQSTYPALRKDQLLMPFLIRYLEQVGVTALIVQTHSTDHPASATGHGQHRWMDRDLRSLAENHLLTWHVPFFGEDRIAISAKPPLEAGVFSAVAELNRPKNSIPVGSSDRSPDGLGPNTTSRFDEKLQGDPHFELYRDLNTDNPRPVPLKIQLFGAADGFQRYAEECDGVFNKVFVPDQGGKIIVALEPRDYSAIREFAFLHSGTRYDKTVVFSVDEYWPDESAAFLPADKYLAQMTRDRDGHHITANDPYRSYESRQQNQTGGPVQHKRDFFPLKRVYGSFQSGQPDEKWAATYDDAGLVPYLWDFGFLLLDEVAWKTRCRENAIVSQAWQYLTGQSSTDTLPGVYAPMHTFLSWFDFLQACRHVAGDGQRGVRPPYSAFSVESLTLQSFASLVLEIWFSQIAGPPNQAETNPLELIFPNSRVAPVAARAQRQLTVMLENPQYRWRFFQTWMLLGLTMPCHSRSLKQNDRPAVAARHWYSTASKPPVPSGDSTKLLRPARLPGRYVTRGDWFLAIARESRSVRLGFRAIDLLSRRRENIRRLKLGIGLPVRDMIEDHNVPENQKVEPYRYFETSLLTVEEGQLRAMNYWELRELGVHPPGTGKSKPGNDLQWLWRSQITNYYRHDRVFEAWLPRFHEFAAESVDQFPDHGDPILSHLAFTTTEAPGDLRQVWTKFQGMVSVFIEALNKTCPSTPMDTVTAPREL